MHFINFKAEKYNFQNNEKGFGLPSYFIVKCACFDAFEKA